jgi:hypothetical protein
MKNSFAAKHARKINKISIFKDKKKALKCGERKHKNHNQTPEHYSIAG